MKIFKSTATELTIVEPELVNFQVLRAFTPIGIIALLSGVILSGAVLSWICYYLINLQKVADLECRRLKPTFISCQLTVQDEQGVTIETQTIQPLQRAEVFTDERSDGYYRCFVVLYNRPDYDPSGRFEIPLREFSYTDVDETCQNAKQTAAELNTFIKDSQKPMLSFFEDNRVDIQQLWVIAIFYWLGGFLILCLLSLPFILPTCLSAKAELWLFNKNLRKLFIQNQQIFKTETIEVLFQEIDDVQMEEIGSQKTDSDGDTWFDYKFKINLLLTSSISLSICTDTRGYYNDESSKRINTRQEIQNIVNSIRSFLNLPPR